MCEFGFHSCPVCKDTSPCNEKLDSNPNCFDPNMMICYCCLETSIIEGDKMK